MIPAAVNASWELRKKTMIVLESSLKTAGIREAMMTRKSPEPRARNIRMGILVMDKPFRRSEMARRMARLCGSQEAFQRASTSYNPAPGPQGYRKLLRSKARIGKSRRT